MPELTKDQRSYHEAEYAKLTAEVAELVKTGAELFKYAVITSGGLFAWLLTNGGGSKIAPFAANLVSIALWLPLGLTVAFAFFAHACSTRLREMGSYLQKLEEALGSPNLGWEKHLIRQTSLMTRAGMFAWITLLMGDAMVPLIARFVH